MKAKWLNLSLLVSLCHFNSLKISVKAKWFNSKKIKNKICRHLFTRNFYQSIAKFSVTWSYFTIVKYNSKTIYHHMKFQKSALNRGSIKKLFLKILQYFTGKRLCCTLFFNIFNKSTGLQFCNFIKKRLQHWCFPVDIANFLRIPVLKNIYERLLLSFPMKK